jgi:DtxR family Mn-dependent transcriptional regulator
MRAHLEDLLEAVWMARELGDKTIEGIRKSSPEDSQIEVSDGDIADLERAGFVRQEEDEVVLTAEGYAIAEQTVRRHRLAEMLMFTLLGADRELASEIGCKLEHGLREELLEGVCTLLGHPATCPHGRPIPPGACCASGRTTVESQVMPLTALKPGEHGRIVYIKPRSHHRLHRLTALGLTPGIEIELHRQRPAFCVRFEETELALDRDVAADIQVTRLPNGNG